MKNFALVILTASVLFAGLPAFAADTYNFDPSHTNITWTAAHLGFSHFTGKFPDIAGTLTLDDAHPENSKLSVTVPTAEVVTGVPKLDEHLKSAAFFNVAKFPKATFVSTKVEPTGKDTANVTGTLTLLGVSKPVVLTVTLNKVGEHPMSHKKTVGFDATTTIKRSDFGLSYGIPMVGDDVPLNIEAEASVQ